MSGSPSSLEPDPNPPATSLPLREYGQPAPDPRLYGSTPPGIERVRRAYRGAERRPSRELEARPGVIRTPLLRPVLVSGGMFLGVLGVLGGLLVWWQISRGQLSTAGGVALVAFALLFGTFLTWMTGVGMTSIGIALTDQGVDVLERSLRPGRGVRRTIPWADVGPLQLNPGGFYLASEGIGVNVTIEQARAVVADPRYAFRDKLPPPVLARLDRRQ